MEAAAAASWLKDLGAHCSGLRTGGGGRQTAPCPALLTAQQFGERCAGPGVHPIKCHVLAAVPTARKNCFKVLWKEKCEIPGQAGGRVQRWLSRRGKAAAIVTTTFSVVDWQADTRL